MADELGYPHILKWPEFGIKSRGSLASIRLGVLLAPGISALITCDAKNGLSVETPGAKNTR